MNSKEHAPNMWKYLLKVPTITQNTIEKSSVSQTESEAMLQ
jgi:hypothetical protein